MDLTSAALTFVGKLFDRSTREVRKPNRAKELSDEFKKTVHALVEKPKDEALRLRVAELLTEMQQLLPKCPELEEDISVGTGLVRAGATRSLGKGEASRKPASSKRKAAASLPAKPRKAAEKKSVKKTGGKAAGAKAAR